jgi:two-component system, chemotaxis family, chemotaxis protein CheY
MTTAPRASIPVEPGLDEDTTALLKSVMQSQPERYPLRILYVEDSPISREVVRMILGREGHSVVCADDGLVGVQILATSVDSIDMVITDHEMPGVNGLGVVEYLRKIGFPGGVLVHSGTFTEELIADYQKLGVRHFLKKPTKASELIAAVATVNASA